MKGFSKLSTSEYFKIQKIPATKGFQNVYEKICKKNTQECKVGMNAGTKVKGNKGF